MISKNIIFVYLLIATLLCNHGVFANNDQCTNDLGITANNKYMTCLTKLFDTMTVKESFDWLLGKSTIDTKDDMDSSIGSVATIACSKKAGIKTCSYELLDQVSPCYSSPIMSSGKSAKNGINNLIDYTCAHIKEFTANKGFKCIAENKDSFEECAPIAAGSPDENQCALLNQMSNCILGKLKPCGQRVHNILKTIFKDTITTMTTCNSGACALKSSAFIVSLLCFFFKFIKLD